MKVFLTAGFLIGQGKIKNKAQSTLELTLSFIVVVMLLSGSIKVMLWGVNSLVGRHNAYISYLDDTSRNGRMQENFYVPKKISLVEEVENVPVEDFGQEVDEGVVRLLLGKLEGVTGLAGNRDGNFYRDLFYNNNIKLRKVYLDDNTLGLYDPGDNIIYIDRNFFDSAPDSSILATIVHELTHVDYYLNPQYWKDYTLKQHPELTPDEIHIPGNSIDQEYNAFKNAVEAYRQLKEDGEEDLRMDYFCAIIEQGEDYAKAEIVKFYNELPQY